MSIFSDLKRKNHLSIGAQLKIWAGRLILDEDGTCCYSTSSGEDEGGVPKDVAMFMAEYSAGHWCCSSCPEICYQG